MFETKNSKILRYVNDYKLNLIVPKEIEDFSLFTSELRQVLRFIAQSKDEESVRRIQNDKDYESVQVDTVRLINACTNTKIPIPNGAKEVNMCKGMQDYGMSCKMEGREEGRKEGRMEGRKEGREEGRMEGRSELIENMLKKGKTSAQIAEFTGISQVEIKAVEESLDNL
jgi:predicted transposase/invertase (TIGR01784 family)